MSTLTIDVQTYATSKPCWWFVNDVLINVWALLVVPFLAYNALDKWSPLSIVFVPWETACAEDIYPLSVYDSMSSEPSSSITIRKHSYFPFLKTPSEVSPHLGLSITLSVGILPLTQAGCKGNSEEAAVTASHLTLNIYVVEVKALLRCLQDRRHLPLQTWRCRGIGRHAIKNFHYPWWWEHIGNTHPVAAWNVHNLYEIRGIGSETTSISQSQCILEAVLVWILLLQQLVSCCYMKVS